MSQLRAVGDVIDAVWEARHQAPYAVATTEPVRGLLEWEPPQSGPGVFVARRFTVRWERCAALTDAPHWVVQGLIMIAEGEKPLSFYWDGPGEFRIYGLKAG